MAGVMTVVIESLGSFLEREGFQINLKSRERVSLRYRDRELVSQQCGPIAKGSASRSYDDMLLSAPPGMMELGLQGPCGSGEAF